MNIILVDPSHSKQLWPLSQTRPVAGLRIGIWTISEKWENRMKGSYSHFTKLPLNIKFKTILTQDNILINGALLPNASLIDAISNLKMGASGYANDEWIYSRFDLEKTNEFLIHNRDSGKREMISNAKLLKRPWEIFQWNDVELRSDFNQIIGSKTSAPIPDSVRVLGNDIFIEPGAKLNEVILNSQTGPIYIGSDSEVMEGSMIRGPFALCEKAQIKMGSKIYGATTIGPECRVGGEVNNSVFQGHSNKAHDGFIGNAVIGEWCNIGADSNCSNLKNNYEVVKVWSYIEEKFISTGSIFCGLIMGDHAKCGINTMFNTGTVVGVGANVFGDGFPRQFIPDFAWGGASGFSTFRIDKFYETSENVMSRRTQSLSADDKAILNHIYTENQKYRTWEK